LRKIIAAFMNSVKGLYCAAQSERAVRQELAVIVLAVPIASYLSPNAFVWAVLVGSILLVLAIELLNSAVELCDHVCAEHHPVIGAIKDMGSAAVLCASGVAAIAWGAALVDRFVT
jgi:diacylglycerol kinase (ATP)